MKKLDYGCGAGGFDEIIYDKKRIGSWLDINGGKNAVGIDINPLRIEAAAKHINNGSRFVVMDGRKLAFPDNYFDIVHEFGVFHHMPDYKAGINEIYRVLKPGGRFIAIESVDNDITFRICRRIFSRWHEDEVATLFSSHDLDNVLIPRFKIESRQYYWRFIVSDFLRAYNLEPQFSIGANIYISKLLNLVGLGQKTCCHYVIQAKKDNK